MIAQLRAYIERKFQDATLERSPFPHLVIEDFFPAEIYDKILAFNPFVSNAGEEWLSAAASANVSSLTPYHARKQINFHANAPFEAAPEAATFWNDIKACFLKESWFESIVVQKYSAYFNIRFGDLTDDPKFLSHFRKELFLQRHEPGYYIGPHTDIPTRVFTCIFSFASCPGFEEFGTELLAHKDPLVRCWGNDHYAPDEFTVKKVAPYKPNNFLLFFKTRQSFHSVKAITHDVPNQRYGMQFQFYEPALGLFKDLSVPDIMATRQRPVRAAEKVPAKAPVAPAQDSIWVARSSTFLKRSTAPASTLPADAKIATLPLDTVTAQGHYVSGEHVELVGAALNGTPIGPNWFLFRAAWDQKQAATVA